MHASEVLVNKQILPGCLFCRVQYYVQLCAYACDL